MMREFFIFLVLAIVVAGCIGEEEREVCFDTGKCVSVEVASKQKEIERGLMYRESLEKDNGMLFIFQEDGVHSFWMKNTEIPLDIIWIDNEMIVVHIETNVPPCKADPCPNYTSPVPARYVLEVNANYTVENGVEVGSKLFLE